jgi:hypothetical protein
LFNDTNIQPYFDFANFFKDIFQLFSNSLKIKEKKTAANSGFVQAARPLNSNASQPDTKPQNVVGN